MEYGGSLHHRRREPAINCWPLLGGKQAPSQDLCANDLQRHCSQKNA